MNIQIELALKFVVTRKNLVDSLKDGEIERLLKALKDFEEQWENLDSRKKEKAILSLAYSQLITLKSIGFLVKGGKSKVKFSMN